MVSFKSLSTFLLAALPLVAALPQANKGGLGDAISGLIDDLNLPDEIEDLVEGISEAVANILRNPAAENVIANRYIVVYNNTFSDDAIATSQAFFSSEIKKRNINKRSLGTGKALSTDVHAFKMNKWRAMTLDADDDMIVDIFNSDEVDYIEADTKVSFNALVMQTNAPVGLNSLSSTGEGVEGYIFDDSAGEGITAYVVDTGIRTTHSDFGGRATFGANFIDDVDTDENGHGSHVSGTIGGATFGVAKKVNLVAVKVLGADGSGANSGVLQGMQFVIDDVAARGISGKAVMNMSLGGGFSDAINRAIEALFKAGIVPVVAAGNEGQDTKNTSPGSAPNAITVGALDPRNNRRASFSNFGAPVDIYAAGVDVLSVGIESDTATAVLSGTSMASPHVAGLSAYLMRLEGLSTPADVAGRLSQLAQQSDRKVLNNIAGTSDQVAQNGNTFVVRK